MNGAATDSILGVGINIFEKLRVYRWFRTTKAEGRRMYKVNDEVSKVRLAARIVGYWEHSEPAQLALVLCNPIKLCGYTKYRVHT